MITNKSNRNNITRSTQCKENIRPKVITRKKPQIQAEQVVKMRPKLGRGRAGIRCKTLQPVVAEITATESKSCKIPTVQMLLKINKFLST